jgi:hypothetical protein
LDRTPPPRIRSPIPPVAPPPIRRQIPRQIRSRSQRAIPRIPQRQTLPLPRRTQRAQPSPVRRRKHPPRKPSFARAPAWFLRCFAACSARPRFLRTTRRAPRHLWALAIMRRSAHGLTRPSRSRRPMSRCVLNRSVRADRDSIGSVEPSYARTATSPRQSGTRRPLTSTGLPKRRRRCRASSSG